MGEEEEVVVVVEEAELMGLKVEEVTDGKRKRKRKGSRNRKVS